MPLLMAVLASCSSKDEFTDSIFDTSVPAVDQTKSTAEFDQWLYDNFVVPYNVQVNYRFDQAAADNRFVLTPANYKRSQLLAHLIMYLYYDVYTKYAGEDFMKQYPRMIFDELAPSPYLEYILPEEKTADFRILPKKVSIKALQTAFVWRRGGSKLQIIKRHAKLDIKWRKRDNSQRITNFFALNSVDRNNVH